MKACVADATKVGRYPLALVPGQFQDYYRRLATMLSRLIIISGGLHHCQLNLSIN